MTLVDAKPSFAGVTLGDKLITSHSIDQERARAAVALAGLRYPTSFADRNSLKYAAKTWLISAGNSADFATLAKKSNGEFMVVFAGYHLLMTNSSIAHINGVVDFETTVASINDRGLTSVSSKMFDSKGEVVAESTGQLLLARTILTDEDRAKIAARGTPPNLERPNGTRLRNKFFVNEEATGRKAMKVTEDVQDLHNPNLWVRVDKNGQIVYEDERPSTYIRRVPRNQRDKHLGAFTRFGGPIGHGVISTLKDTLSIMQLCRQGPKRTELYIAEVDTKFRYHVPYGSLLEVNQWLSSDEAEVGLRGGECFWVPRSKEAQLRLVTIGVVDNVDVVTSQFVLKTVSPKH